MVRLKLYEKIKCIPSIIGFNSTMVRLKQSRLVEHIKVSKMFQFHNGSIKTGQAEEIELYKGGFQFHNGSIKTLGFL